MQYLEARKSCPRQTHEPLSKSSPLDREKLIGSRKAEKGNVGFCLRELQRWCERATLSNSARRHSRVRETRVYNASSLSKGEKRSEVGAAQGNGLGHVFFPPFSYIYGFVSEGNSFTREIASVHEKEAHILNIFLNLPFIINRTHTCIIYSYRAVRTDEKNTSRLVTHILTFQNFTRDFVPVIKLFSTKKKEKVYLPECSYVSSCAPSSRRGRLFVSPSVKSDFSAS